MSLLTGVRVIELCTAWAGPFIGRFLGALGADVVKVESARQADGWRVPMPPRNAMANVPPGVDADAPSLNVSPNFNALNRNKRGIALDLTLEEGRALLLRLVADADVVTANFTERVLPRLRLTYDDLREVTPDVILLSMPALGASGPYKAAVGYGTIIEGMGGFASRFGYAHEGARVSDTYYPDAVAGVHATVAVLAALEKRRRTGLGSYVDLSQQEAVWLQLGEGIVLASTQGRNPDRLGNVEPGCAVSGCYACSDGRFVAIVTRTEKEAAALDRVVDGGNAAEWIAERTSENVTAALAAAGVGVSPVNTYLRAVADPRLAHAFERVVHPVTGEQPYLRVPIRVDGAPVDTTRPAPRFDEHTREVLEPTGADLDRLERDGVISGTPAGPRRAS